MTDIDAEDVPVTSEEIAPDASEPAEPDLVLDATAEPAAESELGGWGEDEEEIVPVESPYDRPGRWYVVHTYSGYENKVRSNMGNVVASRGIEDRVFEVVIPMEDVVEFKGGKKVTVQKKVFPGYLLVRCDLDDDTWGAIRNTPGVTGFVGPGTKPTPLSRREVENILQVKVGGRRSHHQAQPAPSRVRGRRDGAGQRGSIRGLLGPDRGDQRRPAQVEGAGEHLRPRDAGRTRIQSSRQAVGKATEEEEGDDTRWHPRSGSSPW